jgi:hypothetical protein
MAIPLNYHVARTATPFAIECDGTRWYLTIDGERFIVWTCAKRAAVFYARMSDGWLAGRLAA